jgi:hypothetical protein
MRLVTAHARVTARVGSDTNCNVLVPTLNKTRTRTNPVYAFILALRKRVNLGVEIHLALRFICW